MGLYGFLFPILEVLCFQMVKGGGFMFIGLGQAAVQDPLCF